MLTNARRYVEDEEDEDDVEDDEEDEDFDEEAEGEEGDEEDEENAAPGKGLMEHLSVHSANDVGLAEISCFTFSHLLERLLSVDRANIADISPRTSTSQEEAKNSP